MERGTGNCPWCGIASSTDHYCYTKQDLIEDYKIEAWTEERKAKKRLERLERLKIKMENDPDFPENEIACLCWECEPDPDHRRPSNYSCSAVNVNRIQITEDQAIILAVQKKT